MAAEPLAFLFLDTFSPEALGLSIAYRDRSGHGMIPIGFGGIAITYDDYQC